MAVIKQRDQVEIATIRRRYYDLVNQGYSKEDAAAAAQSGAADTPAKKAKTGASEPAPEPLKTLKRVRLEEPEPEEEAKAPQEVLKAATVEDDLTRINGIGSGTARKLSNLGITKYAQIASWNKKQVEEYDDKLGYRGRVQREDWVGQAQALLAEE